MTEIPTPSHDADEDRRKFLATCGKFVVVTPPAITLLLSTSLHSPAIAYSGGRGGGIKGSVHGGGIQGSNGRSWGGRGSWGGSKS
jgi:hypothetical protein